jgi:hypothetical protein
VSIHHPGFDERRVAAIEALSRDVGRHKPHLARIRGRWQVLFQGVTGSAHYLRAIHWLQCQNVGAQ